MPSENAQRARAAEQVVEAVRSFVEPLRGRVDRVEYDQRSHEERTARDLSEFRTLASDTLKSVTGHVERLAKLETIPERLIGLETEVRGVSNRIGSLETRVTTIEATAIGRRESNANLKWFAENWIGLAFLLTVLLVGAAFATGNFRLQTGPAAYSPPHANPTRWPVADEPELVLRGRS